MERREYTLGMPLRENDATVSSLSEYWVVVSYYVKDNFLHNEVSLMNVEKYNIYEYDNKSLRFISVYAHFAEY